MKLLDTGVEPEEVLTHPRHQAAQVTLVPLVERVRACRTPQDGYELQQDLLRQVLEVEKLRNAFSMAVKRMGQGKSPQAGAPEPQSGLDPSSVETWVLERELCERLARQFRSIGDALAWRAFNHDRRYILALCRNGAFPPIGRHHGHWISWIQRKRWHRWCTSTTQRSSVLTLWRCTAPIRR